MMEKKHAHLLQVQHLVLRGLRELRRQRVLARVDAERVGHVVRPGSWNPIRYSVGDTQPN